MESNILKDIIDNYGTKEKFTKRIRKRELQLLNDEELKLLEREYNIQVDQSVDKNGDKKIFR